MSGAGHGVHSPAVSSLSTSAGEQSGLGMPQEGAKLPAGHGGERSDPPGDPRAGVSPLPLLTHLEGHCHHRTQFLPKRKNKTGTGTSRENQSSSES